MKITLSNGAEKEIVISKVYTRKVDRGFNEIIFDGMKANPQQLQSGTVEIELSKMQKANDFLIVEMTNLTVEELDEVSVDDYNKILEEIEKVKIPSK